MHLTPGFFLPPCSHGGFGFYLLSNANFTLLSASTLLYPAHLYGAGGE